MDALQMKFVESDEEMEEELKLADQEEEKEIASFIQSDPKIMMGKPVIAGTRITVEAILSKLAAGESIEQLVEEHARLTRENVLAAIAFAAKSMNAKPYSFESTNNETTS